MPRYMKRSKVGLMIYRVLLNEYHLRSNTPDVLFNGGRRDRAERP